MMHPGIFAGLLLLALPGLAQAQSDDLSKMLEQAGVSSAGLKVVSDETAALRTRVAAWRAEQKAAETELQGSLTARPLELRRVEKAVKDRDRAAASLVTARTEPMLQILRRLSPQDALIVAPLLAPRPMVNGLPIAPPAPPAPPPPQPRGQR